MHESVDRLAVPTTKSAVTLLALVLIVGCSSTTSKFCTAAGALPEVTLDVSAFPSAREVCVDQLCEVVHGGSTTFSWMAMPSYWRDLVRVDMLVRDDGGEELARWEAVRIPRSFPNGADCPSDGPSGSMTLDRSGEIHQ